MVKVLFVCMGNICRSPMAEGAFRAAVDKAGLSDRITIDSAGTISYHAGNPPDRRAQATAKKNGIDISGQRARQVRDDDFHTFDHILVMDHDNLQNLMDRAAPEHQGRIELFMSYAPDHPYEEMPDPYYGEVNQFDLCFEAAAEAAAGLLEAIKARHL
ncbi:low molecular weight protein-tyrosine-phosphatase [Kordiimonas lipolytica]|uniref:protein-tyrosine-phosphatase n=1 Tax=Kordiimonas lipolytica TaxID=1662421 RepID=A0ABV8UDA1_9PROT|nr:low molecular weight protein-tyrosine-phosphatase [Kordiimonas lipolytica]